jgi:hypothetical protein
MRRAVRVAPWPNGLGWDVGTDAEVWKPAGMPFVMRYVADS